ncbi:hypothetical protein [Plantibacter flavus]|uniref:hypothetical protein n=1 Tax=Plantibacter flavus TaxID=150123 RepID=UPI003F5CCC6C
MTTQQTNAPEVRTSWVPMVGLFLAQILMSFNVSALPVSLGGWSPTSGCRPRA